MQFIPKEALISLFTGSEEDHNEAMTIENLSDERKLEEAIATSQ